MRTLKRNKQLVWYATFVSKSETKDAHGNLTGQYQITYSDPVKAEWNVCFIDSDAEVEMFGIAARDVIRIVAPKDDFPLDEASILWFGKKPGSLYEPTHPKHNYVIAGIRPSLNQIMIYAKKV